MSRSTVQPEIPITGTLLVHAILGAGLVLAGALTSPPKPAERDRPGELTDFQPAPLAVAKVLPKQVVVPDPPPLAEETPPVLAPSTKPVVARTRPITRAPERAPASERSVKLGRPDRDEDPDDNQDEAAPLYRLPDNGAGGSISVPEGVAPRGPYGSGGRGSNTKNRGGGSGDGPPDSTGSGAGPISVASIKTRAKPIGDVDYEKIGRDYPIEAKRLGIEGKVKVRLIIDAAGAVSSRRLIVKKGHGLDKLALKLAKKLRFEAAIDTNDKPVRSVVVWTFNFVLPRA